MNLLVASLFFGFRRVARNSTQQVIELFFGFPFNCKTSMISGVIVCIDLYSLCLFLSLRLVVD